MKHRFQRIANIATVGCIIWIGFEMLFGASIRNQSSRDALRQIHQEVDIGNTKEQVASTYERNETHRTQIKPDEVPDTWVIGMPTEFGATDPILYIQFGSNKRVSAVAMRTSDGIHLDLPSGYGDKGTLRLTK